MPRSQVRFSMVLHAHQPTGNFDFVFQETYNRCYKPLIDELEKHPNIPVALHYSGILLNWLEEHEPDYCDRLRVLVKAGQVELLGGGIGEPILVMLSDRDRRRQIDEMSHYLETKFGVRPRGLWLTERVWEQALVQDIAGAGMEFTMVDDSHLRIAGVRGEDLDASYVTEDRGATIRVFPLSEKLRYLVPFREVSETIEYLRSKADGADERILIYGDDTEKFGGWPGTFERVYERGWLRQFLTALGENRDAIEVVKVSDALAAPPAGKVHMPDASYREMTEWALPTVAGREFAQLHQKLGDLDGEAAPFFRGGNWRNFLSKYPESGEMYGRMMEVSRRVAIMEDSPDKRAAEHALLRGQCNCAFWHGVFGGLYLPHLRFAIYKQLMIAEAMIEKATGASGPTGRLTDFDYDGRDEAILTSGDHRVVIHPFRGGHLVAIDDKNRGIPLAAGMTRREEVYHHQVRNEEGAVEASGGGTQSIHDLAVMKESGLRDLLVYDKYKRESLIDHFFSDTATLDRVARCEQDVEAGDFVEAAYECSVRSNSTRSVATLNRTGSVKTVDGVFPVRIEKRVELRPIYKELRIGYRIENLGKSRLRTRFGAEFLLALLAGDAHDRNLFAGRDDLGVLAGRHDLESVSIFGARDRWLDVSVRMIFSRPAAVWTFPIRTVNNSEAGFESVYQGTVIIPHWELELEAGKAWAVGIRYVTMDADDV